MRIELERPLAWPVRPVQTSAGLHVSATSILIACADRALGIGMHDAFERNGHRIHVTHDPIAALDTLEADGSIGIVAVELALPHFDGLALVERMRKSVQRHLQVIVVAPNATAADVVRAMHLRAADFVSDPQDGSQLHGALARALAAHQAAAPLPAPAPPAGNGELHGALEDAYRHGLALIEAVKALREGQPAVAAPVPAPAPAVPSSAPAATGENRRLAVLRALQQSRVARDKYFPKGLFEDPCWDMLLDLMANHLRGRRISVSSLCMASGVAQTTALRRITELHDRGLVRRIADEKDGRRVFIELTEQGIAALSGYVEHIQELT
ncbi:response regulator transcription factor [Azospirillum sp. YIM DDC1]|uniref:Response regulator transcription factor n=1 Tax=Azospirillum aestuarii TaxID=2802052 RepID=A0ABS1HSB8_9PROT|nr:response regulator transcription factor [Azospirillum aestuarii]MBK3778554.1 response regulator [Azospirillum brasilense]MBK4717726.1 response regulator transcription factor [Azospirillum aestuarii]TWA93293.1 winged helix DNA-binding protein [Azospirillum brasilense]